jgi:photosystem II reaction center protein PsbM
MMHGKRVALCLIVLVGQVAADIGFQPVPAVPLHRAQKTQPQTAPNGVVPPRTMPGRGPAFMQPMPQAFPLTRSSDFALSASQQVMETMTTAAQEAEQPAWGEAQFTGHALEEQGPSENAQRSVAMQAEDGSFLKGFASGIFATFGSISLAFLALRKRIQRQSVFSTQEMSDRSASPSGPEPVYSVNQPELRDSLKGRLVALFGGGPFIALAGEGMAVSSAAYLAVLLGTFVPVVFLVTLFIQSEARKAAESGTEGNKF